jgi:phosphoribosylanthranilate isomerase
VRVKICGVTTPEDARAVAMLGADAVGLNFYPQSPRHVNMDRVAAVLDALPPFVEAVGICVHSPSAETILEYAWFPRLHVLQWHGQPREPASLPRPLIAAFSVSGPTSLDEIAGYVAHCRQAGRLPAAVLVDAHVPGQHGGTGQTAPWDLLADFDPGVPLILAGGLTPDNVAEAIRRVRPYAVDVASGVESSPGRKDLDKVRRFIDNARNA